MNSCTENSKKPGVIWRLRQEDHELKTSLCQIKTAGQGRQRETESELKASDSMGEERKRLVEGC